MARARVGGNADTGAGTIELEYDIRGRAGDPAVLLIGGLGSQLISWDDEVVDALAGHGYRVIRFDNRDSGLSTVLDVEPDLLGVLLGAVPPPYRLDDLAGDAVGLLDHLGVRRAHLVGISMGGMVAQLVALAQPGRVASVTALLAGPPGRPATLPAGELVDVLLTPAGPSLEERVESMVRLRSALANGGSGFDATEVRSRARHQHLRAHHPGATLRQVAAVLGTPGLDGELSRLAVPALFVHGELDPLISVNSVRDAVAKVPEARLMVLSGVGHDLPRAVALDLVGVVTGFWASAAGAAPD